MKRIIQEREKTEPSVFCVWYAVDLIQPHRMAFSIKGNTIEIACIEEIIDDYH